MSKVLLTKLKNQKNIQELTIYLQEILEDGFPEWCSEVSPILKSWVEKPNFQYKIVFYCYIIGNVLCKLAFDADLLITAPVSLQIVEKGDILCGNLLAKILLHYISLIDAAEVDLIIPIYLRLNNLVDLSTTWDNVDTLMCIEFWEVVNNIHMKLYELFAPHLNVFFVDISSMLFSTSIDVDAQLLLRTLRIKALNLCLEKSNQELRNIFRVIHTNCVEQLIFSLNEVGDYDFQTCLIEAVIRITSTFERTRLVKDWFPNLRVNSQRLFVKIQDFDPDCRKFLNEFNYEMGVKRKVFTYPCIRACVGNFIMKKPNISSYEHLWVDFNLGSKSVSMLFDRSEESSVSTVDRFWETIIIFHYETEQVYLTNIGRNHTLKLSLARNPLEIFASPPSPTTAELLNEEFILDFEVDIPELQTICQTLFGDKLKVQKYPNKMSQSSIAVECVPDNQVFSKKLKHELLDGNSSRGNIGGMVKASGSATDIVVENQISLLPFSEKKALNFNRIQSKLSSIPKEGLIEILESVSSTPQNDTPPSSFPSTSNFVGSKATPKRNLCNENSNGKGKSIYPSTPESKLKKSIACLHEKKKKKHGKRVTDNISSPEEDDTCAAGENEAFNPSIVSATLITQTPEIETVIITDDLFSFSSTEQCCEELNRNFPKCSSFVCENRLDNNEESVGAEKSPNLKTTNLDSLETDVNEKECPANSSQADIDTCDDEIIPATPSSQINQSKIDISKKYASNSLFATVDEEGISQSEARITSDVSNRLVYEDKKSLDGIILESQSQDEVSVMQKSESSGDRFQSSSVLVDGENITLIQEPIVFGVSLQGQTVTEISDLSEATTPSGERNLEKSSNDKHSEADALEISEGCRSEFNERQVERNHLFNENIEEDSNEISYETKMDNELGRGFEPDGSKTKLNKAFTEVESLPKQESDDLIIPSSIPENALESVSFDVGGNYINSCKTVEEELVRPYEDSEDKSNVSNTMMAELNVTELPKNLISDTIGGTQPFNFSEGATSVERCSILDVNTMTNFKAPTSPNSSKKISEASNAIYNTKDFDDLPKEGEGIDEITSIKVIPSKSNTKELSSTLKILSQYPVKAQILKTPNKRKKDYLEHPSRPVGKVSQNKKSKKDKSTPLPDHYSRSPNSNLSNKITGSSKKRLFSGHDKILEATPPTSENAHNSSCYEIQWDSVNEGNSATKSSKTSSKYKIFKTKAKRRKFNDNNNIDSSSDTYASSDNNSSSTGRIRADLFNDPPGKPKRKKANRNNKSIFSDFESSESDFSSWFERKKGSSRKTYRTYPGRPTRKRSYAPDTSETDRVNEEKRRKKKKEKSLEGRKIADNDTSSDSEVLCLFNSFKKDPPNQAKRIVTRSLTKKIRNKPRNAERKSQQEEGKRSYVKEISDPCSSPEVMRNTSLTQTGTSCDEEVQITGFNLVHSKFAKNASINSTFEGTNDRVLSQCEDLKVKLIDLMSLKFNQNLKLPNSGNRIPGAPNNTPVKDEIEKAKRSQSHSDSDVKVILKTKDGSDVSDSQPSSSRVTYVPVQEDSSSYLVKDRNDSKTISEMSNNSPRLADGIKSKICFVSSMEADNSTPCSFIDPMIVSRRNSDYSSSEESRFPTTETRQSKTHIYMKKRKDKVENHPQRDTVASSGSLVTSTVVIASPPTTSQDSSAALPPVALCNDAMQGNKRGTSLTKYNEIRQMSVTSESKKDSFDKFPKGRKMLAFTAVNSHTSTPISSLGKEHFFTPPKIQCKNLFDSNRGSNPSRNENVLPDSTDKVLVSASTLKVLREQINEMGKEMMQISRRCFVVSDVIKQIVQPEI